VVWRFSSSRQSIEAAFDRERPVLRSLFRSVGYNIDHSKLVGLVQHALTLSSTTIAWLALGLAVYAVIEVIEGTGLWLARRWGEYFAMVVTSLGLPYEIYELAGKVTVTKLLFFAVNLALVLYLVITKRLLGVRGGKRAYEARLRSESVLEGAYSAAAEQEAEAGGGGAGQEGAGGPVTAAGHQAPARREAADPREPPAQPECAGGQEADPARPR
jgi:uncharacterized membrane protein (DUF2068 family)